MDGGKQSELLEIYKLHAELADRVSRRREGANRFYAGLLTAVLLTAFLGYGTGSLPVRAILTAGGVLGVLLSASWYIVIRSYRQLNAGKFDALHELEEKLAYPFFKREWELLKEGRERSRYWKLTVVETGLPLGFLALSAASIIIAWAVY